MPVRIKVFDHMEDVVGVLHAAQLKQINDYLPFALHFDGFAQLRVDTTIIKDTLVKML